MRTLTTQPSIKASTQPIASRGQWGTNRAGQVRSQPPISISTELPLLQRQCACGGGCPRCQSTVVPTKLTISDPGDIYEQEADRVADQVMQMSGSSRSSSTTPQRRPPSQSIQQQASGYPNDVAVPQAGNTVPSPVHTVLHSPGQALDMKTRSFMEERLGHDFSQVRVHTDAQAAASAQAMSARAYTFGHHVVFGNGQYSPTTQQGKHLLAHELAHVIQQQQGRVMRQIQRAEIPYQQVTWADFKGSVPANSPWAAETNSGFKVPGWKPEKEITDTKEACEVDKTKTTKHTARVFVNPAVFDAIQGIMVQEKSWVRSKYTKPDKHCDTVVTDCQQELDKQATASTQQCQQQVKPCQDAFDQGSTRYSFTVDGTEVTVSKKADCATQLVTDCAQLSAKNHLYELTSDNTSVVKAKTKAECKDPKFKESCTKHFTDWSQKLLKHEQGHFDISNVIASKAKADLKAKAAKYTVTVTECGRVQANNEAVKQFDALNAPTELSTRSQDWLNLKDKAGQDYDDQTDHGLKLDKQATWEKDIAAGLKAYDLNKPTTPPPNPTATPTVP